MSKGSKKENLIIALAYLHRYGLLLGIVICIAAFSRGELLILAIGCLLYAVWTFVGYKCRWKHIFCSYQNTYRQRMTPNNIRWGWVKKSDVYATSIILLILSVACLVYCCIFGLA